MTTGADWLSRLAELIYDALSLMVDGLPEHAVADLAIAVDRGHYNGQAVQGIAADLTAANRVGQLRKLVARLPGDTAIEASARMSGPRIQRDFSGKLALSGERPAQTLRWLMAPPAGTTAASPGDHTTPFRIALALSSARPGSGCENGASLQADIRLGSVTRIDVPLLQHLLDGLGQVTSGKRPILSFIAAQPCDPLLIRLTAAEIGALPDLVRALTDARPIRIASERAPRLRDVDLKLAVSNKGIVSINLGGGLTAARAAIFRSCSAVHPRTRRARDFSADVTARFDAGSNRWSAGLKSVFTCLDLVEAQALAQAATGLDLKGAGAAVRQGDIATLSLDITVPPSASLRDLMRVSGTLDFVGDVAIDLDDMMLRAGAGLLGLEGTLKRGVLMGGRVELRNGVVSGLLSSKDPALGNPRHANHRFARKWADQVSIAFRGNLGGKTLDADVTVRSTDWRFVRRDPVCFDPARKDKTDHFPAWVQLVTICIPLSTPSACGRPTWRQLEQREYACR